MKPSEVVNVLKMNAGVVVDEGQMIWWEKRGLLGEVPRTRNGRRDYASGNVAKCFIVVVCKMLGWSLEDVRKMLVDKHKDLIEKFKQQSYTLVHKFATRLQTILVEWDKII